MKTSLLFSLLLTFSLFAQEWTILNPRPFPNTPYVTSAPSVNKFIAATSDGHAVFTTDGGTTWKISEISEGIYRSIYFINDNFGWAAGATARLAKTIDGGTTWIQQPNAPDTTKYDIFFIDQNTGWSVGYAGFIIKTTNGGENWFSQSNTGVTNKTLYGVAATDLNNIYVAGGTDALLRSTDGGNNWTLNPMVFANATDYRGLYFPPTGTGLIGYAAGSKSRVAKTTDGGATWFPSYDGGGSNQLWAVHFNNNGVGLACGAASTLLRTSNNGTSWTPVSGLPASIIFYSVRFASTDVAYLSGGSGDYFKSTDAGLTWTRLGYKFTTAGIETSGFANNNIGWIANTGWIAKTTDGGYTWFNQTNPLTQIIYDMKVLNKDTAFISAKAGGIIRTTNGGTDWVPLTTNTTMDLCGIDFISPTTGFAGGQNGIVLKTTDCGNTWTEYYASGMSYFYEIDFVDSLVGYGCGYGMQLAKTSDGGVNWTVQLDAPGLAFWSVAFKDKDNGIVIGSSGNSAYFTTDGGTTWSLSATMPAQSQAAVEFTNTAQGSVAFSVGSSSYIYRSTDGGNNWIEEPRFSINSLTYVSMTDASNFWFVGNAGYVLKYFNAAYTPVELTSFIASTKDNDVELKWQTATEINNRIFEIERTNTSALEQNGGTFWIKAGSIEGKGNSTSISNYTFIDKNIASGSYSYRIKQIDFDGSFRYHYLPNEVNVGVPGSFEVYQNYPNPFNPETRIKFALPAAGNVSVKIYNELGQQISEIINADMSAGIHEMNFNASGLASGVYIYKVSSGAWSSSKKMLYLK